MCTGSWLQPFCLPKLWDFLTKLLPPFSSQQGYTLNRDFGVTVFDFKIRFWPPDNNFRCQEECHWAFLSNAASFSSVGGQELFGGRCGTGLCGRRPPFLGVVNGAAAVIEHARPGLCLTRCRRSVNEGRESNCTVPVLGGTSRGCCELFSEAGRDKKRVAGRKRQGEDGRKRRGRGRVRETWVSLLCPAKAEGTAPGKTALLCSLARWLTMSPLQNAGSGRAGPGPPCCVLSA